MNDAVRTPPPRGPRHWPAWVGIGIAALLARLPWSLQRVLGRGIGRLLMVLFGSRRRVAARNLALCFPELDADAQAALLRRSFEELGIGLFEFARAWWGSVEPMRGKVTVEGLEHLQAARAGGRGVIIISGHFVTLELAARLMCDHAPLAGMYRPHDGAVMEWAVLRGRLRYASAMFGNGDTRAAIRHLKRGGFLWYAPDQDMRGKDTVFAPFFGIPAATITATHQFSRLTGCAVVPFFHKRTHHRHEGDRYVLRIGQPLAPFPTEDAVADTSAVNAAIEDMVREAPSQYLWLHRRFKRQPEGAPPRY